MLLHCGFCKNNYNNNNDNIYNNNNINDGDNFNYLQSFCINMNYPWIDGIMAMFDSVY
jgi:hypothetical protein